MNLNAFFLPAPGIYAHGVNKLPSLLKHFIPPVNATGSNPQHFHTLLRAFTAQICHDELQSFVTSKEVSQSVC